MNEASDDVSMAPETMDMGGALPHTDTDSTSCLWAVSKSDCLKQRASVQLSLLCSWTLFLFSQLALQRAQGRPGRSAGLSP